MIRFRKMELADISAGLWLCRSAHWNQTALDWELLLRLSNGSSSVAEIGNKIIGTVTTATYGTKFSWIGMVLVDPAHRRKGLGTTLLEEAIRILEGLPTIRLDATTAGREVYLKLNFHDECSVSRMQGSLQTAITASAYVRRMEDDDLESIASFDEIILGAPRRALLKWYHHCRPDLSFVYKIDGEIHGYCLGRSGFRFTQLGPVVANSRNVAQALALAALRQCANIPVIIDAMHFDEEWLNWLSSIGFTEQRRFTRMYRGQPVSAGLPLDQFAIAGPEFG